MCAGHDPQHVQSTSHAVENAGTAVHVITIATCSSSACLGKDGRAGFEHR